ncbi:hypothetical protein EH165_02505 [Nakamurella antarctica]|uniref:DUF4149 domain-containing protein n=1 Tax=Nakamurella antarctica TaxID=1902245 RepID=A0A3G8ZK18_9ACTN|nr:hypothetical protein [Nakamurella antarctica]AZI57195.1 hypothetical protein EH165_02505 [Nakamurella antarctica]
MALARPERWALSAALVGAPAAYLLAQIIFAMVPREKSLFATLDAHSSTWLISHLLLATWLVLLIPSLAAIWQLLGRGGWGFRVVGGALTAVGIVVNGLITGVDFVLGAIAPMGRSLATSVHKRVSESVLAPLDSWDLALSLGLLVLAIGLYRTRNAPQ